MKKGMRSTLTFGQVGKKHCLLLSMTFNSKVDAIKVYEKLAGINRTKKESKALLQMAQ